MNLIGQDAAITEIHTHAEDAARRDLGSPSWSSAARTVCLFGLRESSLRVPIPPARRFVGKSLLFLVEYCRSYRTESQEIRKRYHAFSCCAGMVMGISFTTCLVIMNAGSYAETE